MGFFFPTTETTASKKSQKDWFHQTGIYWEAVFPPAYTYTLVHIKSHICGTSTYQSDNTAHFECNDMESTMLGTKTAPSHKAKEVKHKLKEKDVCAVNTIIPHKIPAAVRDCIFWLGPHSVKGKSHCGFNSWKSFRARLDCVFMAHTGKKSHERQRRSI